MIVGSEPVSIAAIDMFNEAFAPFGLPPTAFKPSYGIAEATLFVATIDHQAKASVVYFDREQLAIGRAERVPSPPPVHRAPGRLVGSLHGRQVGVRAHVVEDEGREGRARQHGGRVPEWLASRMAKLGAVIAELFTKEWWSVLVFVAPLGRRRIVPLGVNT